MGIRDLFFTTEENPMVIVPTIKSESMVAQTVIEVDSSDVVSVQEIYAESVVGIERGIYQIIAFIEALPSSMDSVARKETLLKMLTAAGLNVELLYGDSETRLEVLEAYKNGTKDYLASETDKINGQIEELRSAISMLEEDLKTKNTNAEQQTKIINEEIGKVKSLQSYVSKQ